MLLWAQTVRSAANRAKWDDEFVVKAELVSRPPRAK